MFVCFCFHLGAPLCDWLPRAHVNQWDDERRSLKRKPRRRFRLSKTKRAILKIPDKNTEMASIIFSERENATLHTPALKMRQRLQSVPENLLKTPLTGKKLHAPLQSGRKALGLVNKIPSMPTVNGQEKNKLLETQETKVKTLPQTKVEEYPDIEMFIPYDPLEYENYVIPEDVVCLGHLALPGLVRLPEMPCLPEEDFEVLETYTCFSLKNLQRSDNCATELDAFLQTINKLTIDLPPEMDEC
ncbi:hypothetical protein J4Q44_G00316670 [Coregonus suidteri]|uniref:Securin n=1 Tax=Coregonus suidteri TaxID=861788 RepID=A0AAN8QR20_9TELE